MQFVRPVFLLLLVSLIAAPANALPIAVPSPLQDGGGYYYEVPTGSPAGLDASGSTGGITLYQWDMGNDGFDDANKIVWDGVSTITRSFGDPIRDIETTLAGPIPYVNDFWSIGGTQIVALTVYDAALASNTATVQLRIVEAPEPSLAALFATGATMALASRRREPRATRRR